MGALPAPEEGPSASQALRGTPVNLGSKGHPRATQRLSRCLAVLFVLWLQGPKSHTGIDQIRQILSGPTQHSNSVLCAMAPRAKSHMGVDQIRRMPLVLHSNRIFSLAPSASLASEVDYDSTHGPWSYSVNAYRTLAPRASATSDPAPDRCLEVLSTLAPRAKSRNQIPGSGSPTFSFKWTSANTGVKA